VLGQVDALVTPSEPVARTLREAGVAADRVRVVPHFVEPPAPARTGLRNPSAASHVAWVGRISPEKGLLELLRQWPAGQPLVVVGDGPDRAACAAAAPAGVSFTGSIGRADVAAVLAGADALLVSSLWPETFGLVYAEAIAAGTPVAVLAGSVVAEAVAAHGTGTVVARMADLPATARDLAARGLPLREHCRAVAVREFGRAAWLERMTAVYTSVGARAVVRQRHPRPEPVRSIP
jgi:glycosyltransferase involved in cell wall biosynthesis